MQEIIFFTECGLVTSYEIDDVVQTLVQLAVWRLFDAKQIPEAVLRDC